MASSVVMYMLFLALAMHRVRQLDCFTPVPISLAVDYKHTELFGKGDGKKRRKKKSSSPAPNSSPEALQPAPLRVTSDSNVPVKRQIQWARMNKVSLLVLVVSCDDIFEHAFMSFRVACRNTSSLKHPSGKTM